MSSETAVLGDFLVDHAVPTAPYYQIREGIRREIQEGRLNVGDRLPSVRALAKRLRVSSFTVGRAFGELAREGLLESRTRAGTRVIGRLGRAIEVLVPTAEGGYMPPRGFFDEIRQGIQGASAKSARRCFLSCMDEDHASAAEILAVCRARQADGLIVYRPEGHVTRQAQAVAGQIATASLMYPVPGAPVDWVQVDAGAPLRRWLLDRLGGGRRALAFVGIARTLDEPAEGTSPYLQMQRAVLDVARQAGIEPMTCIVDDSPWSKRASAQVGAFARTLPKDALVVLAFPALVAEFEAVGRMFDFISYTESGTTLRTHRDHVTILYAGIEECARVAAGMVLERIAGSAGAGARTARIEPEIVNARAH